MQKEKSISSWLCFSHYTEWCRVQKLRSDIVTHQLGYITLIPKIISMPLFFKWAGFLICLFVFPLREEGFRIDVHWILIYYQKNLRDLSTFSVHAQCVVHTLRASWTTLPWVVVNINKTEFLDLNFIFYPLVSGLKEKQKSKVRMGEWRRERRSERERDCVESINQNWKWVKGWVIMLVQWI